MTLDEWVSTCLSEWISVGFSSWRCRCLVGGKCGECNSLVGGPESLRAQFDTCYAMKLDFSFFLE